VWNSKTDKVKQRGWSQCLTVCDFPPPFTYTLPHGTLLTTLASVLIGLFGQNHPYHVQSPGTQFNIKVLQFLLLLESWSGSRSSGPEMCDVLGEEHVHKDIVSDLRARRQWMDLRAQPIPLRDGEAEHRAEWAESAVENEVYRSWECYRMAGAASSRQSGVLLAHLLSRFMELSAEMAEIVGEPNRKWMTLAGEFMLQASIEVLEHQAHAHGTEAGILECFAWGWIDRTSIRHSDVAREETSFIHSREELINDMFCDLVSPPLDCSESWARREIPLWTEIRARFLSELHLSYSTPSTTAQCQSQRLAKLHHKFPLLHFKQELLCYIEGIWALNGNADPDGKPVLAQIEEGHLEGMGLDEREFDEFIARVGLKRDGATKRFEM